MKPLILAAILFAAPLLATPLPAQHTLKIEKLDKPSLTPGSDLFPKGAVLIDGLGASDFHPAYWQADTLHWVNDLQYPLFAPKLLHNRNIYSASTVEEPWGWRVFYAVWDGTEKSFDCLYEGKTSDGFLTFTDRKMVVSHGEFKHVSNADAIKLPDGTYDLLGTSEGLGGGTADSSEMPAVFTSKNGDSFNGDKIPYDAKIADNLPLDNYPNYAKDHFNGSNVLFQDSTTTRLIFHEWTNDKENAYYAEGKDPWHLKVGGIALHTIDAPNDLRKFSVAGKDWYLLALYRKADVAGHTGRDNDHTWFSLSNDARKFSPDQIMTNSIGRPDLFIFSVDFVTRGSKLLGILYGASEDAATDRNSIFAQWLQKRPFLVALPGYHVGNGGVYPADGALGPDRERFTLPKGQPFDGSLELFDDDGKTPLGSVTVHLDPGNEYRITY